MPRCLCHKNLAHCLKSDKNVDNNFSLKYKCIYLLVIKCNGGFNKFWA